VELELPLPAVPAVAPVPPAALDEVVDPEPVVDDPEPGVDDPEPLVDDPEPVVEDPEPVVDEDDDEPMRALVSMNSLLRALDADELLVVPLVPVAPAVPVPPCRQPVTVIVLALLVLDGV